MNLAARSNRLGLQLRLRHSAAAERSIKPNIVRRRPLTDGAVLHLVRHGGSRVGLSADCAWLFEMSRSNPSSGRDSRQRFGEHAIQTASGTPAPRGQKGCCCEWSFCIERGSAAFQVFSLGPLIVKWRVFFRRSFLWAAKPDTDALRTYDSITSSTRIRFSVRTAAIGEVLTAFTQECANYLKNSSYRT
jgi:hypothetical protein